MTNYEQQLKEIKNEQMYNNNFDLSEKIKEAYSFDTLQQVISMYEVKKFIRLLKEDIECNYFHTKDSYYKQVCAIIDKLAGDKLK